MEVTGPWLKAGGAQITVFSGMWRPSWRLRLALNWRIYPVVFFSLSSLVGDEVWLKSHPGATLRKRSIPPIMSRMEALLFPCRMTVNVGCDPCHRTEAPHGNRDRHSVLEEEGRE